MNSVQKPTYATKTGYGTRCAEKPLETTYKTNTQTATSLIQNKKVLPKKGGLAAHVMKNQLYNHHLPASHSLRPFHELMVKPQNPKDFDEEDPSKFYNSFLKKCHFNIK